MTEEKIIINSGKIKIEGLLDNLPGEKGVVVSHPHPLYGGDMHNNVVEAICRAYRKRSYTTLRFNFRGVGNSEGSYDNGIGEQDDVESALAHLLDLGKNDIDLAGYSFGSWVNALGINRYKSAKRVIMISPPVYLMDFSSLNNNSKLRLIICGANDDIAHWESVEKAIPAWNPKTLFKVVQGADHFYWGKTGEIEKIIGEFLELD